MTERPASPWRRLRRRDWREAGYAALDLETTGLDLVRDDVVSFGVVPIRAGRVVLGDSTYREVLDPPVREPHAHGG
jgi:DNA polymerase III alpha subunit (gram-positive type)